MALRFMREVAPHGFAVIAEGDHLHIEELDSNRQSIAGNATDGYLTLTGPPPERWRPNLTPIRSEAMAGSQPRRYRVETGDPMAREEAKVADRLITSEDDAPVAIKFWHTNQGVKVAANIQRYLSASEARSYATDISLNGPRCFPKPIPFTWVPPVGPVPGYFYLHPAWAASAANPDGPNPGVPVGVSWTSVLSQITIAPKAISARLSNPITVELALDANRIFSAVFKTPQNLVGLDIASLFAEVIADLTIPSPVQVTSVGAAPLLTDFPRYKVVGVEYPDYNVFWDPETKASERTRDLVALLRAAQ